MAKLFRDEHKWNDANTHIERAESKMVDSARGLGGGTEMQAESWYQQRQLGDAKSETLRSLEVYERFGDVRSGDLQGVPSADRKSKMGSRVSRKSDSSGDFSGSGAASILANSALS